MELINGTRMPADVTVQTEVSGRELLVIVVKGTFRLPEGDGRWLGLHDEQAPLVMSDVFAGEPGLSAPKYESDFAPAKHRCDVLVDACARTKDGRLTDRITVGVAIGTVMKSFDVVGDRQWEVTTAGIRSTSPLPFTSMPITYDRAFGGTDERSEKPEDHVAYTRNPSGRGFHKQLKREWLAGSPLPNTEESGRPVKRPDGSYAPMSFGPVGRHWDPRRHYAGTYDQYWLDDVFPFLPPDFDGRYFQAAPIDQQLAMPVGSHRITLLNLTPDGRREFQMPHFDAPISVFPRRGGREELPGLLDTICIEPDLGRLTITWRASRPLKKSIFEIDQVLVGRKAPLIATAL